MARTRGQNNIAKPSQKFSPSSTTRASKKTKAEPPAPSATAQGSTSDTKNKGKGKSKKTKQTVPAQAEEEPEQEPEEEQDAAGGGPVVSAIRDEREAPQSLPQKAKSAKARGKRQTVDAELDKGLVEADPAAGAGEASSSGAVEHAADEERNEPASSGSSIKGKSKLSSKASRKPAKPRKKVTKTPKSTGAKAKKDEAHEEDDGADRSASNHGVNSDNPSKGPGKATKPGNRATNSSSSTENGAVDHEAGEKDDDPKSSAAKSEEAAAKPKSAPKSAAKSTRAKKKKANQPSSAAEKSIVEEKDDEAGPSAPKGKSDSKSASKSSLSKTKPSKKATKPKAAGSKIAQNAPEEGDGEPVPPVPTTRNESMAATGESTGAKIEATNSQVTKSKKGANKDRTEASSGNASKTATTKGRKKKDIPPVDDTQQDAAGPGEEPQDKLLDDTQHDTAGPGEEPQDEPLDDSNKRVQKPRKQAATSKTTKAKRSADKSNPKKPSPNSIPEPTIAGDRRKRKRPLVGDTNDETDPGQGHQDEAPEDRNSKSKRSRPRVAAPKSAATKVVKKSRALDRTSTPDHVDDPVEAKPKRGRGRPPKKSGVPAADPKSGEGSSAAAKGRGKGRRKPPPDTTYRHSVEDEGEDEARLSGDAEDHDEEKGSRRKKRRVQDPTYHPDADAWSEPSPLSEHRTGVHPVRDRKSREKDRNVPVWEQNPALHVAGYVNNLLPPSKRALHRSPDFDKRGKMGWYPSNRKKREGPDARRGEVTKAAPAKTGDNDDPADDTQGVQSSAPEGDQGQDAHGSQTSGSEEGESDYRSDRNAGLRASRRGGRGSRSLPGPSSQRDTTSQPSKGNEPVSQTARQAKSLPSRRPGDGDFRSKAGPAPRPSGIRGVSGLSIPSVQPNTLQRPQKTVGELKKEERQHKRDAKRRRIEDPDSAAEETSSQQHPTVSFEDPAPGSQEGEAPQKRAHKRRHSSIDFTDPRRTRSWPTLENPASRRVPAETDNPSSPGSAREKLNSEPGTSTNRVTAVAIPAIAIRDDAWSEVLRASSSGSVTADSRSSGTISSPTSSAARPGPPRQDSFMDATISTAFGMFYRLCNIPWKWSPREWREVRAKELAAEKRREREKAKNAAAGEEKGKGKGKGKGRVTKSTSTRSKKPVAAKKGKEKQKETSPEAAEAPEAAVQESEDEEQDESEEEHKTAAATGQEPEKRTAGSMNTHKDPHKNVLTITQTTTTVKKTPPEERSRSAPTIFVSPQTRSAAAAIMGIFYDAHNAAEAMGSPDPPPAATMTPLRRRRDDAGQGDTDASPRTRQLAQLMADFRQGDDGLQAARDDGGGGGQSGRESPLLGSDFEDSFSPGGAPDEVEEEEVGGLTEDQGTTEDEGREAQTPGEGNEDPLLSGGMFRMAQRLVRKSSG